MAESEPDWEPVTDMIDSLPSPISNELSRIREGAVLRAIVAGAMVMGALLIIGLLIRSNVSASGTDEFIVRLFLTMATGIATGHYMGLALKKSGTKTQSFLFGFFATLFFGIVFAIGTNHLVLVLVLLSGAFFLVQNVDMVAENERVEHLVQFLATQASPTVLTIIVVFDYIWPVITSIAMVLGIDLPV